MPPRKKAGYNWKARLTAKPVRDRKTTGGQEACLDGADSNALVLPSKKQKLDHEDGERVPRRKKLSSRQRKHLQKVLEAKEKKEKHAALLKSLSTFAIPSNQLCLLRPSTDIGKSRKTNKQLIHQACVEACGEQRGPTEGGQVESAVLSGTAWRKRKKRRRLVKAEKVLYNPRIQASKSGEVDQDESNSSDSNGEGSDTNSPHNEMNSASSANTANDSSNSIHHDEPKQRSPFDQYRGKESSQVAGINQRNNDSCVQVDAVCNTHPVARHLDTLATSTMVARPPPMPVMQLLRPTDVQAARLSLPILSEEQEVMEAIGGSAVVVLCGETGSGKTTQVPQFLYEAGYTSREGGHGNVIGVTEPRRVAAVSMSKRVAFEMGLTARQVSYQIRYEGNASDDTLIKFMTDGILLKEVENDFLLSKYSVIVIDEAHERSVFTDILIGLLSRIVPLREKNGKPLKLVIMSATLRVEDFTENISLFPSSPPVIKIESRQYPVTVHFNKRTRMDYLTETYRKVCKIHRTLKAGNILVFVTGQSEVKTLCKRLRQTFPLSSSASGASHGFTVKATEPAGEKGQKGRRRRGAKGQSIDLDSYPILPDEVGGEDHAHLELEGVASSDDDNEDMAWGQSADAQSPMLVLPLYSLLSTDQQAKVFESPPEGVRMCVVSTNVAETSLTIPGTKYVVDTGLVKMRFYDKTTGVSTFRVVWTSKASANQRAGRAGRTEPGHCYRLFSSAVFQNEFDQFSPPEITRRPVEDLVLQMKAMNIDKVINFPFPTPPSTTALQSAEDLLLKLGALESGATKPGGLSPRISPLGHTMSLFPVSPRYAKMLSLANQHGCLPYIIVIVAALSVKEIFITSEQGVTGHRRAWTGKGEGQLLGDVMVLLRAVGACEYASCSEEFCQKSGLRRKAMLEVRKLRQQLTNTVNAISPESEVAIEPSLAPPSGEQTRYIRQIVLAGLGDHVARKVSTDGLAVEDKKRLRHAYQSTLCEAPVFLHPSSSLLPHLQPSFVVFQEIIETSKLYMRVVSAIEEAWLPLIVPEFCSFSAPLETPPPFFDVATGTVRCYRTCTYGNLCWPISAQELPYPDGIDKYKVFAMFLLQGKVVSKFAEFAPYLLVAPVTMMKTWSKLHRQCEFLLTALASKEVCSRDQLLATWEKQPKYLLKAYSMWLPESRHKQLAKTWPPIDVR